VPRRVLEVRLHEHCYLQPGIADMVVGDLELEGGVSAHLYLSWLHPEKTATVTVVGRERMLAYEGRFEKRGLTLYDYAIDRANGNGDAGAASIIPIRHVAARRLEVPAAAEPLALAAEHFLDSVRNGTEPLTSGARSVRLALPDAHGGRGGEQPHGGGRGGAREGAPPAPLRRVGLGRTRLGGDREDGAHRLADRPRPARDRGALRPPRAPRAGCG